MLIETYASASDFELLGTNYDSIPTYEESIEEASEDRLRCFAIEHGYSDEELDLMQQGGMSLRDIVADIQTSGATFQ